MAFFAQLQPDPYRQQAGQLGEALGMGITRRHITPEQQLQLAGLDKLQQEAMQAGGDPTKLAFLMAKANIFAPGTDRALGQMYQQLVAQAGAKQLGENLAPTGAAPSVADKSVTPGEITPTGPVTSNIGAPAVQPNVVETKKEMPIKAHPQEAQINDFANEYISMMRPDLLVDSSQFSRVPKFNFGVKMDLTPEEEGRIRQELSSKNVLPQTQEKIIERTREGIKNRYNEAVAQYGYNKEMQEGINAKWKTFTANSQERLKPFLDPYKNSGNIHTAEDLTNKYMQYGSELSSDLTPEQMHSIVMEKLRGDMNAIEALKAIPSMPISRNEEVSQDYYNDIKKSYKPLIDRGYYQTVKEDAINNKDMGVEDFHYAIFGDQTDKGSMNRLSIQFAPERYTKSKVPGLPDKINNDYDRQHENYINYISSGLEKIKPKDDLILLRAQVLNRGGTERDFLTALSNAQEKGLKLSPFQQSQYQELLIPRKPPLWQIFNPGKWGNFINYIRGKK